jgi:hypothetical protein
LPYCAVIKNKEQGLDTTGLDTTATILMGRNIEVFSNISHIYPSHHKMATVGAETYILRWDGYKLR